MRDQVPSRGPCSASEAPGWRSKLPAPMNWMAASMAMAPDASRSLQGTRRPSPAFAAAWVAARSAGASSVAPSQRAPNAVGSTTPPGAWAAAPSAVKTAVTLAAPAMVRSQVPAPTQLPPQPEKRASGPPGVAVSRTTLGGVLVGTSAQHSREVPDASPWIAEHVSVTPGAVTVPEASPTSCTERRIEPAGAPSATPPGTAEPAAGSERATRREGGDQHRQGDPARGTTLLRLQVCGSFLPDTRPSPRVPLPEGSAQDATVFGLVLLPLYGCSVSFRSGSLSDPPAMRRVVETNERTRGGAARPDKER